MQTKPRWTMQPGLGWLRAALLAAVLGLLPAGVALAQRTEGDRAQAQGAYQAEVPVRNQTDAELFAGLKDAVGLDPTRP